mmetsp:Transcript_16869/g.48264  ORF Transcript_16869/g.48264 Transcript_16869/m.48264 type:complete len:411 (-) Transcript_16869:43-1275(-)
MLVQRHRRRAAGGQAMHRGAELRRRRLHPHRHRRPRLPRRLGRSLCAPHGALLLYGGVVRLPLLRPLLLRCLRRVQRDGLLRDRPMRRDGGLRRLRLAVHATVQGRLARDHRGAGLVQIACGALLALLPVQGVVLHMSAVDQVAQIAVALLLRQAVAYEAGPAVAVRAGVCGPVIEKSLRSPGRFGPRTHWRRLRHPLRHLRRPGTRGPLHGALAQEHGQTSCVLPPPVQGVLQRTAAVHEAAALDHVAIFEAAADERGPPLPVRPGVRGLVVEEPLGAAARPRRHDGGARRAGLEVRAARVADVPRHDLHLQRLARGDLRQADAEALETDLPRPLALALSEDDVRVGGAHLLPIQQPGVAQALDKTAAVHLDAAAAGKGGEDLGQQRTFHALQGRHAPTKNGPNQPANV